MLGKITLTRRSWAAGCAIHQRRTGTHGRHHDAASSGQEQWWKQAKDARGARTEQAACNQHLPGDSACARRDEARSFAIHGRPDAVDKGDSTVSGPKASAKRRGTAAVPDAMGDQCADADGGAAARGRGAAAAGEVAWGATAVRGEGHCRRGCIRPGSCRDTAGGEDTAGREGTAAATGRRTTTGRQSLLGTGPEGSVGNSQGKRMPGTFRNRQAKFGIVR